MTQVVDGLRRLSRNAGRLVRLAAWAGVRWQARATGIWIDVELGSPEELPPPSWGLRSETLGLLDLLRSLDCAKSDPQVVGVVLIFRDDLHGWSKVLALHRALLALRAAGKRVVAWGESFGAEQYLLASAAEKAWLPASGALHLVGLRTEQYFLRELLQRIDVRPELVRIGNYKSAGEIVTRDGMSPESREQIESWQGDVFSELVNGIANGRGLEADVVRSLIDRGPFSARAAVEEGLLDGCLYPDEIDAALQELEGAPSAGDPDPLRLSVARYFALRGCDSGWHPLFRELPRVAYVVASGAIRRGRGHRGISSGALHALLEEVRDDDSIRAVVLRIDSPGGDAVASDLLYRSVEQLAKKKPVVVSMGDVAASGGYYIAAAGHAILAEAGTLTGSIGVFGGKLNFDGLYQKLGIAKDAVEHGARAGLLSEAREFTPDERAAVRAEMQSIYDVFLERVATGRELPVDAVERVAGGRIFSGEKAGSVGLVDMIGGPLEALREASERAGLREDSRLVIEVAPQRSIFSGLTDLLQNLLALP